MLKSVVLYFALSVGVVAFVINGSTSVNDESASASEKLSSAWKKVMALQGTRGSWPSIFSKLGLFTESMSPSVDYISDEFPSGRSKLIHSVGVIAQVTLSWDQTAINELGYTGLFTAANYGTIRASSAIEPDFTKSAVDANFVPGVGFKFFRTGVASANFFAMHLLKSWDTFNWFKYPLSNHLSKQNLPIPQELLALKFSTVSNWATFVGLSDFATYDEDGIAATNPGFPYQLLFVPNPDLKALYSDAFEDDYFTQFTRDLKAGTLLYYIHAIPSPGEDPVAIGTVVTSSDFITSKYADTTLFLKHQRFEEDLAIHPEWAQGSCTKLETCKVCPVDIPCGSDSSVAKE